MTDVLVLRHLMDLSRRKLVEQKHAHRLRDKVLIQSVFRCAEEEDFVNSFTDAMPEDLFPDLLEVIGTPVSKATEEQLVSDSPKEKLLHPCVLTSLTHLCMPVSEPLLEADSCGQLPLPCPHNINMDFEMKAELDTKVNGTHDPHPFPIISPVLSHKRDIFDLDDQYCLDFFENMPTKKAKEMIISPSITWPHTPFTIIDPPTPSLLDSPSLLLMKSWAGSQLNLKGANLSTAVVR